MQKALSRNLPSVEKATLRIGLISDTHEAENPVELIAELKSQKCDLYIHLGDIGGSHLASKLAREFKQTLGNVDHLSEEDRLCYESLRKQGMTPIWAYIETKLGTDAVSRERRLIETRQRYSEVVDAMSKLPRTIMLSGNIDRSLLRARVIGDDVHDEGVPLVVEPELLDLGSRALILWPSMKHSDTSEVARLHELVDSFVRSASDKEQIVVFAHEQIYKGPPPGRYKKNVESAGYQAMTIPYFEPNPSWQHLLRLFRSLRPSQQAAMAYGHVHDPHHVIQAGAPYLRGSQSEGLRFRLHGLGSRAGTRALCSNGRRTVRLFTIPAEATAILHLSKEKMRLEVRWSEKKGPA